MFFLNNAYASGVEEKTKSYIMELKNFKLKTTEFDVSGSS